MLKHILLPLDGSNLAEHVLPHAITLSNAFDSKISLIQVIYQGKQAYQSPMVNPMDWQMLKTEVEAYLNNLQERLIEINVKSEVHILEGNPAEQILEFARSEDIDLIILSSHGKSGPSAWNINSTVQKVLMRAFMPVMIIRAYQESVNELKKLKYERLILPLDGSNRAECVLPLAKSICEKQNSKIFLAHIIEEPKLPHQTPVSEEVKALIDQLLQVNEKEASIYFDRIADQFDEEAVEVIIERSRKPEVALHNIIDREKADLVLLSAHGYSGESRWPYGNIALNFLSYGTTPLIIIQDLSKDEIRTTVAEKYAEQAEGH